MADPSEMLICSNQSFPEGYLCCNPSLFISQPAKAPEKLRKKKIKTCGDLRNYSKVKLAKWFGRFGERLHELAYGVDNRPVEMSRRRKSLSVEHTYERDLPDIKALLQEVFPLLESLETRWEKMSKEYLPTKRVVKLKFNDFTQTTLETVLPAGEAPFNPEAYQKLFEDAFDRKRLPVRLAGIGIRLHDLKPPEGGRQLSLFDDFEKGSGFRV